MKLVPGMKNALHSLGSQKGRTILMMLGVIVGVGMLTSLVAFGEHTKNEVEGSFRRMMGGTWDVVVVTPQSRATQGMPTAADVEQTLTPADMEAIGAEIPGVRLTSLFQGASVEYVYQDKSMSGRMSGVSAEWLRLWSGDKPAKGEHFTEEDDQRLNRVAVIGAGVARTLFGDDDPIGKTVRINNVNVEIKGVFRERGGGMDNIAYMPFSTFSKRVNRMDHLTMAMAHLTDPSEKDAVMTGVMDLMRRRHQIPAGAPEDFRLTSPIDAMQRQLDQVAIPFEIYIQIGSLIALLIGGLVVMNIMTISVSERTKEIGLRRSIGAKQRDIILQFLFEAVAVTLIGGIIGVGLSIGGSYILSFTTETPPLLSWTATGLALGAAVLTGLLFGILPARKAALLDPITAIRA